MSTSADRFPLLRWVAATTAAETIGMTAAATASVIAGRVVADASSPAGIAASLAIIVAGGLIEGAALGLLPARVLHRWRAPFRSRWWFVATLLVAGLGLVMGALLGAAQAPAFRAAVGRPGRWVAVSTIAWTPTMVVMFGGATLPDASWSPAAIILTGVVTGVAAGAVLGLVTGVLMPMLDGRGRPSTSG